MLHFRLLKFIGSLIVLGIIAVIVVIFIFKQKPLALSDLGKKALSLVGLVSDKINTTIQDQPYQYGSFIRVAKVLDGETVILENNDKLRYIGVDAPELNKTEKIDCFSLEAANENQRLVEGKKIRIEKDISERDKFGRLLGYVYLEDGTFVNMELVKNGFAIAAPFEPDTAKASLFKEIEKEAKANKLGLWGKCK
ncbi:MAG: thermonuclease family protein [Candidatus Falkowbacteria bacterium]|nr:thermonuclease family protein [Candidatus Falkowbacteria bacterium]